MNLKRLLAVAATIATIALPSALVISPAVANGTGPSLPSAGDRLFAMASNGTGKAFGSIDVSTGAAVGLATDRLSGDAFTGAAYDPTTGTPYVINEISNHQLQSLDSATGALTTVAKMWLGSPSVYKYGRSIAIADSGAAYAIVDNHWLYSLNLVTAEVILIGDTGRTDLPSLAFNPVDDLLYAVDGTNGVFTIDLATGAATQVGENAASMCGFQIDRAGVVWYKECGGDLFSATDLEDIAGTAHAHGPVTIDSAAPQIWAILYVPDYVAPYSPGGGLANTGVVDASGFALAGFVLIAAGAVVAARRRARG
jgi:LPXTG-motif cell wall-anchored protein